MKDFKGGGEAAALDAPGLQAALAQSADRVSSAEEAAPVLKNLIGSPDAAQALKISKSIGDEAGQAFPDVSLVFWFDSRFLVSCGRWTF